MDGSAWVVVATTGLWWCGTEMWGDGNWKAVGAVAAEERLALWWAALGVVRADFVPCKDNTEVLVIYSAHKISHNMLAALMVLTHTVHEGFSGWKTSSVQ